MSPASAGPGEPGSSEAAEAYDLAACGLLTTGADGTILRVNRTLCAWTGYDAEELVGRRFQDLLTMGSKLFHQTHWMPLMQLQGSVAEVQLEMRSRDGRALPVLVNAAGRAAQDPAIRPPVDIAVFVATDRRKYERELLLARRRAEELLEREREAQEARARSEEALRQREIEFRTLAENSPDVILRFDIERRCVYLSPAVRRLSARPPEAFMGRGVDAFGLPEAESRAWARGLEEAFAGRDATLAFSYEARSGARRELQTHLVPERNARGEVVTVLGITRDVTVLRQAERDAQQRAAFAEQLIGIVSHDLRSPLNAILLGARLLGAPREPAAHASTAARIASAALRANRLITDLLDFTQARLGGGLRVDRRELDVHQVAAECVDEIRLAWPNRAIELRRVGEGKGEGDADRLAQALTNLVSNALTYGEAEEPVSVTTSTEGDAMEILVHNGGAPIPVELQASIFEPMRRGAGRSQPGSRSVGLGLYIVREIARAHGGSVRVHSTEREGTTFAMRLPRWAAGSTEMASGSGAPP